MEVELFQDSPIGTLVPIRGTDALGRDYDHFAYVPARLPQSLEISDSTWNEIAAATLAIGRLDGEGRRLPNPRVLSRPLIRAEAVSSSALEGTYTTLPRVLQAELLREVDSADVEEVMRQIRASELAFDALENGQPLSLRLIRAIHGELMQGSPLVPDNERGEWRTRQNFIGPTPDCRIEDAVFVPPPPGDTLINLLFDWERWINNSSELNALAKVALAHYQFEALHPFIDGNGRIGRLVSILQLLSYNVLTNSVLNLSPYLEAHREEYQRLLRETSQTGSYDAWIRFYSQTVRARAEAVLIKVERLQEFRERVLEKIKKGGYRGVIQFIVDEIIGYPVITPTVVRRRHNITYQAALYALGNLEKVGVVSRLEGTKRQVYIADEVLNIIHD